MRIISVDPGYGRAGIAIIDKDKKGQEILIMSTCIETPSISVMDARLLHTGLAFEKVLEEYEPEALAMEGLFFGKNKKTAIGVAEMRGIFRFIATKHSVPVFEYNPMTVKSALSGGDKKQMQFMVEKLLQLPKKKRLDDEYDAIAIGLAHLALYRK